MPDVMTVQAVHPPQAQPVKKGPTAQERKYKCAYCARAFSRSEHRSRHERSHTKERPFKCLKCRSTFVRRDLLLRHDRTVHAKDGGVPLHSEVKRRPNKNNTSAGPSKPTIRIETATLEQLESNSDSMVDLEQAAMLITELHQAAVDQEHEEKSRRSSPGFDGTVPYVGAIPVHDMSTYDPPTPSSTGPDLPRMHCSFSSDSNTSWSSSSLQIPGSQRLSMERSLSSEPSHSYASSPNPYARGASPSSFSGTPTPSQSAAPPMPPTVMSDHERNMILDNIRQFDAEKAVLDKFKVPSRSALNRYLVAFFSQFHHQFPFLHPATFRPVSIAPPLLLAVLSIGALYTFEKEQAYTLHLSSKVLVNNYLHRHQDVTTRNCPLWTTQTLFLNMVLASWSGDAKGLEWANSIKDLLANMVAGGVYELVLKFERRAKSGEVCTREDWIEEEGHKRTFFAVYIFFGLLTLTYNSSAITYSEFDKLPLPCSESLWSHEGPVDDLTWREALANEPTPAFKNAHTRIYNGEVPQYSSFGARIVINALFLDIWSINRNHDVSESALAGYKQRLREGLDIWQRSLDVVTPETVVLPLSTPQNAHPLVFNSLALYRCSASRLEVDLYTIQEAMRCQDEAEVSTRMSSAATAATVQRSEAMNKVIQLCFECFQIPALMGIRWVARTSSLNWGVEQPLCGSELVVILSLWLSRIEEEAEHTPPTPEEQEILTKIRNLFAEDSVELYGSRLSAGVARVWGGMIDEVVVWGITHLLGESFKLHSHTLALNDESGMTMSSSSASTPSPETDVDEMDSDMD